MSHDYDLIVIGSGPAGFSCAMQGAKFDKKVLMVEANEKNLGGTWINTGTVPSKALREAAKTIYRYHSQFGIDREKRPFERFRMEDLLRYKQSILDSKNRKVREDLKKNRIETVHGFGKLIDEHTVEVTSEKGDKRRFDTDHILISTGSRATPVTESLDPESEMLDHTSILELTHIPRRLVIMGGGINAIEYATIFGALGTRVSVLNELDDHLVYLDREVKEVFQRSVSRNQVTFYNGVEVRKIRKNDLRNCTEVCYFDRKEERLQVIETEHVLHFGHQGPASSGIGLERLGVGTDGEGFIQVNEHYQSARPSIYAAGDVIGFPSLASVSFLQGRLAACHMFDMPVDSLPNDIPFGIYTLPEIAGIGLTEQDAEKMGIGFTVGRAGYNDITQADLAHTDEGLIKLIFETETLLLLGVHIIGEGAIDLIHLGQSVMSQKGDIRYFIQNVINYPSFTEGYRVAAFNGVNQVYNAGTKYRKILEKRP